MAEVRGISELLPLVSVVTCSYNNARYIRETLESIKNQTYGNIELVIVDDCSTDDSVGIIEYWLKSYNRPYKFIRHDKNKGGSKPYNIGIAAASGKYYSPIDSDDVMLPEKIERQVALLEAAAPNVAAVYSDAFLMDVEGQPLKGKFIERNRQFGEAPSADIYRPLLQGNFIPLGSLLIKKQALDEVGCFDESLAYGDYDLWLRLARQYHFLFSDYTSAKYRIRPGSLSHTTSRRNWHYSDARIYLKHLSAPLPVTKIKNIAKDVYFYNDEDTAPLILQLAEHMQSVYIRTAWLLWKLNIPFDDGNVILSALHDEAVEQHRAPATDGIDANLRVFIDCVVPNIPASVLKKIAWQIYMTGNSSAMPLVHALAGYTDSKYIKVVWFLVQGGIPSATGSDFLSGVKDNATKINIVKKSTVAEYEDFVVNEIVPAINAKSLADAFLRAYADGEVYLANVAHRLADKYNNSFFLTLSMLHWLNIPVHIGGQVLSYVKDNLGESLPVTWQAGAEAHVRFFIHHIVVALPHELQQQIAFVVYKSGNEEFLHHARDLWKRSGYRYNKALWLLWKYKVPFNRGVTILEQVKNHCNANLGARYIDFCVYRDIFVTKKLSRVKHTVS